MRWHRNPSHDDAANDASRPWWDQASPAAGTPTPDFDAVLGGDAPAASADSSPAEAAPTSGPVRRTVLGGLRALRPLTAARGVPAVATPEPAAPPVTDPSPASPFAPVTPQSDEEATALMPPILPPSFAPQTAAPGSEAFVPLLAYAPEAPAAVDEGAQADGTTVVRPFVADEFAPSYDGGATDATALAFEAEVEAAMLTPHVLGTLAAPFTPDAAETPETPEAAEELVGDAETASDVEQHPASEELDPQAPVSADLADEPAFLAGTRHPLDAVAGLEVPYLDEGDEEPAANPFPAAAAGIFPASAAAEADAQGVAGQEADAEEIAAAEVFTGQVGTAGLDAAALRSATESTAPDPLESTWAVPVPEEHEDDEELEPLPHPDPNDIAIPQVEMSISFGERIERLIAAAVTEADHTRADAKAEAEQLLQDARLDAEHQVAAAQRQAAEVMASTQSRCDDELAAAHRTRQESEQVLAEARKEADELRKRVRDEVAELRAEIDEHAQAMLARTHAETGRTLAAARAELEEIAARKAELEAQMTSIRALLNDAVVAPLPQEVSGFLSAPTPVVEESDDAEPAAGQG